MREPSRVIVVNTSPDAVELMRGVLQTAGFLVFSCYTHDVRDGRVDIEAFVTQHQPHVIAYDLAPPYCQNFQLFQHVQSLPALSEIRFVLTSVNPANVTSLVGRDERVYEIVDRERDLMAFVQAVKEAARARPTR